MIDCHASPKPRPLRLRGPNHPHRRLAAAGPSCTKPQTSERHGEKNETVTPKIGVPGAGTRSRGLPLAGATRPLLSLGWGTPTPRIAAPQPRACRPRVPASASGRHGDSSGKGHKAPSPATCSPARRPSRPPAPPTACGGHSPGPAALASSALSPAAGPGLGQLRAASAPSVGRSSAPRGRSHHLLRALLLRCARGSSRSALPPRRAHPAHTHSPAPSARPTCDSAPGCPLPPASKKPEAFVP